MRLYVELAPWFDLVSPPAEHAAEAARYRALILAAAPSARSLLDLGAGGGNNASHLKRDFACTLTDVSAPMLELSRALNPESAVLHPAQPDEPDAPPPVLVGIRRA